MGKTDARSMLTRSSAHARACSLLHGADAFGLKSLSRLSFKVMECIIYIEVLKKAGKQVRVCVCAA